MFEFVSLIILICWKKKERKGKRVIWFYGVSYYCSEMGGKEILLLMKSKLEIIINYI